MIFESKSSLHILVVETGFHYIYFLACPATRFARELQVESLAEHHTTRLKTHEVETFLNHFDHLTSLQLGANYSEFDWRILRNESLLKLHRLTVYGEYLLIRDERALCEILTFCTESAHCAASERVLKFFALATPVEFAEDVARVSRCKASLV